jgi:hypothetical protein
MKKIFEYNDFLFENLNELTFKISDRLKLLLNKIEHKIAKKLLEKEYDEERSTVTLIDYDDNDISKFTYSNSNKIYDYIKKNRLSDYERDDIDYVINRNFKNYDSEYVNVNKTTISIGKIINKIFPNEFKVSGDKGNDIESFVNEIKQKRNIDFNRFKIVEGNDIIYWYDDTNYDSRAFDGSSLGHSCMRYSGCYKYINFYAINPVKLVILMSDKEENKIIGRALLWDVIINNDIERQFMDRIYTIYDYDVEIFKDFAKKNGWLYKKHQNMSESEKIVDSKTGEESYINFRTNYNLNKNDYYPYMDTLKYFYMDNLYLSNDDNYSKTESKIYKLESTSGGYEIVGEIFVEYYDRFYSEEDLTWCDLGEEYRLDGDCHFIDSKDVYATDTYCKYNCQFLEWEKKYELNDNIVYLKYYDVYVSIEYIENKENKLKFSSVDEEYYKPNDCKYSEYYETYIVDDDSVVVYTDLNCTEQDIRIKQDDTYFEYINDKEEHILYDNDLEDNFIKIKYKNYYYDIPDEIFILKDDLKKYFKYKNYYYDINKKDDMTGQLKLKLEKKNEKNFKI